MPSTISSFFRTSLPVLVVIMFVLTLSVGTFTPQSLRLDESQSLWQSGHSLEGIFYTIAQDVHVPLYHLLLHYWQLWFGHEVAAARWLSLVFFLASIPLLYLLGRRLFNERVARFTVALTAVSPFLLWFGSEIRMYTLLVFITLLNQLFFLELYQRNRNTKIFIWLGYTATVLAGIYAHYFFFLFLLAQIVFIAAQWRQVSGRLIKNFLIVGLLAAAAFAPWLWYVDTLGLASNTRPLIPTPTTIALFNAFSNFLFGFQTDAVNSLLLSLWPLIILFGFFALKRNEPITPEVIYLLLAVIIPVVAAFLGSIFFRPLFLSRYLIFTLPSLYLLIAWLFERFPPTTRLVAKSTLLALMAATLVIQVTSADTQVKENYREAVAYLETNATARDVIILSAPFTIYPVEYYYHGPASIVTIPEWDRYVPGPIPAFDEAALPGQLSRLAETYERAWVLLSYDQGYEEKVRLFLDGNLERLDSRRFSPGLTLHGYRLRYNTEPWARALARAQAAARD